MKWIFPCLLFTATPWIVCALAKWSTLRKSLANVLNFMLILSTSSKMAAILVGRQWEHDVHLLLHVNSKLMQNLNILKKKHVWSLWWDIQGTSEVLIAHVEHAFDKARADGIFFSTKRKTLHAEQPTYRYICVLEYKFRLRFFVASICD